MATMKNMVVIGCTGTGKSTLCNVLAGEEPDHDTFPVGHDMSTCTNVTTVRTVKWMGETGDSILHVHKHVHSYII